MSGSNENILNLTGVSTLIKNENNLVSLFYEMLKKGMHGLCFSPYLENQEPGVQLTSKQIENRIKLVAPYTKWIRYFSCTDGNENIPRIAKDHGLKTLVGAWLGEDEQINEKEIENCIKLAKNGHADIIAIGNEVLYRGDLSESDLLVNIYRVKNEIKDIPVGYVDAYYEFENRPKLTEACDVVLANCYPFWEGCHIDYSLLYVKDMYNRAVKAAKGKKVIITETGWPNIGEEFYGALPSVKNALKYFINIQNWAHEDNIEMFYFSSFDEAWKTSMEGDVGGHWGIWDSKGTLKYINNEIN